MARANPVLVYLKPRDRKILEILSKLRRASFSLTLVELLRDSFVAAYGHHADPGEVLKRVLITLDSPVIETQRAKRKRKSDGRTGDEEYRSRIAS